MSGVHREEAKSARNARGNILLGAAEGRDKEAIVRIGCELGSLYPIRVCKGRTDVKRSSTIRSLLSMVGLCMGKFSGDATSTVGISHVINRVGASSFRGRHTEPIDASYEG